ncbi:hypothetical protein J7M02_03875 [Candidatus Aerophobetes bacterium]|nr:hypothetical protein [Candidatus Aerophobetes bacterium]
MKYKDNFEEVINRYRAFWKKEKADRVLFLADLGPSFDPPIKYHLQPEKQFEHFDKVFKERKSYKDDYLPCATPRLGLATSGGIWGCEIEFTSESSWCKSHPLDNWDKLSNIVQFKRDSFWYQTILKQTEYLSRRSDGKFCVGQLDPLGPADIIDQLRGTSNFLLDFYEHPRELKKLAEIIANQYIKNLNEIHSLLPHPANGTCYRIGIWSPGRGVWLGEDIANSFSSDHYREFIMPWDKKIIESFDHSYFHLHTSALHILDDLMEIKRLNCIEFAEDPNYPTINIISKIRKVQKEKCVIVTCNKDEVKDMLKSLDQNGLLLYIRGLENGEEVDEFDKKLKELA